MVALTHGLEQKLVRGLLSAFFRLDPFFARSEHPEQSITQTKLLLPRASIYASSPQVPPNHLLVGRHTGEHIR